MASDAGGRGPKLTIFATRSNALAPSKPPVWSGGGATSGGLPACAGCSAIDGDAAAAALAEDESDFAWFEHPQAIRQKMETALASNHSFFQGHDTRLSLHISRRGLLAPQDEVRNKYAQEVKHDHRSHENEHGSGVGSGRHDGGDDGDDQHRIAEIFQKELRGDDAEQRKNKNQHG